MLFDVQTILTGWTAVTAIVQDRIANGLMPQDYARPFMVWEVVTEVGERTLSCKPGFDDVRIRIHSYSKDAKQARQLHEAGRDAIEDGWSIDTMSLQLYDEPTKLFHWVLDTSSIQYR